MEPQLLFAKAAPVATHRASRDNGWVHAAAVASRARGERSAVGPADPNEPGCPSGTMGKSVGDFIEVFNTLEADAIGSSGADVHENEPSSINDGGLALHLRGGCGATQQNEEEEEEEAPPPALVPIVDRVQRPKAAPTGGGSG